MKKFISALLCIATLLCLMPYSLSAEENPDLEFRPAPEIIKIKDINNNELFEVVEETEGELPSYSYASGARIASKSNNGLYEGFYDGRKLGKAKSDGIEISAFVDINGKAIAFENSNNFNLDNHQIVTRTSALSPFHFKRHMYSNGYFFITQTIFVPEAYTRTDSRYYSYCYDTVNNIVYQLPGEISEVNEYGEAFFYEFEYSYTMGGVVSQLKAKHNVKLKKYPIISVFYNNEKVLFDQLPVIDNGRTLVPLRAIFEKIGAEIAWDGETSTITATKDGTTIKLTLNSTTAYKNGEEITLDVPAKSVNGRTLVPVRFIADCFGVNVEWKGDLNRVVLTSNQ